MSQQEGLETDPTEEVPEVRTHRKVNCPIMALSSCSGKNTFGVKLKLYSKRP